MDVVSHQISQRLIDNPLGCDPCQPTKPIRDHKNLEVSASALGAGMAFVEGALVDDFDMLRLQLVAEDVLDRARPSRYFHHHTPPQNSLFVVENRMISADLPDVVGSLDTGGELAGELPVGNRAIPAKLFGSIHAGVGLAEELVLGHFGVPVLRAEFGHDVCLQGRDSN